MKDEEKELIEKIMNKKVLTDEDLEILAKYERARYYGRRVE